MLRRCSGVCGPYPESGPNVHRPVGCQGARGEVRDRERERRHECTVLSITTTCQGVNSLASLQCCACDSLSQQWPMFAHRERGTWYHGDFVGASGSMCWDLRSPTASFGLRAKRRPRPLTGGVVASAPTVHSRCRDPAAVVGVSGWWRRARVHIVVLLGRQLVVGTSTRTCCHRS